MQFTLDESKDCYILRLHEERLNSQVAPDLKAQLLMLIGDEHRDKIIVDVSQVNYVDSSGLGALLLGLRQARANDKKFALVGARKRVNNLIHIAHLDDVLFSYSDEVQALANMNRMN
ncbi:STAS domain-containing protein [candidate division KSB1 bacterium]|nr:STAS domain-containing protein [candidate division KSB1 bacterium]